MRRLILIVGLLIAFALPSLAQDPMQVDCSECCSSAILAGLNAYVACGGTPNCIGELISAQYGYAGSHCPSCNCQLP